MTEDQLIVKLQKMLAAASGGEKMVTEVLFGVIFAEDIKRCGIPVATLAKRVGTAGVEIRYGCKLADYVSPNYHVVRRWRDD